MNLTMNDLSRHTGNNSDGYRLPYAGMTEDEIEDLVGRVSDKVVSRFYEEVGRGVMKKILWVIGLATISLLIWLAGTGKIKIT